MSYRWDVRRDEYGDTYAEPEGLAQLTIAAAHEAAHAVVAHVLGCRVLRLTAEENGHGETAYETTHPGAPAFVGMAGHAAEVVLYDKPMEMLPPTDLEILEARGYGEPYLRPLLAAAMFMVRQHEGTIRRVADELERSRTMRRRRFLQLVKA